MNIFKEASIFLAPVVQTLDSAIHRINHYPADKYYGNQYAIRWIVIYPVDSAIRRLNNRGLIIVHSTCELIFAFYRRAELKPACILLLVVTVTFFTCPDF